VVVVIENIGGQPVFVEEVRLRYVYEGGRWLWWLAPWLRRRLVPELRKGPAILTVPLPHAALRMPYTLERDSVLPIRFPEQGFERVLRNRAAQARGPAPPFAQTRGYAPPYGEQLFRFSVYDAAGRRWNSRPMRVHDYQRACLGEDGTMLLPLEDKVDDPEVLPVWGGSWNDSGRVIWNRPRHHIRYAEQQH
jgi:hypothetical protein